MGPRGATRPYLVLAICCASVVVVVMDIAIVNVALPSIRHFLGTVIAPLTTTALSGMPHSMAALATSLP